MTSTQQAQQILKKYFGYSKFRPLQQEIIQAISNNEDCVVLMPTGGGKSITFQIPALMSDGIAIVVSPLIALMKDQVENLKASGITAAFVNSSQTIIKQQETENDVINGKIKLLYVSPERLLTEQFYNFLQLVKVNLFAIDEAHCISQWGHDFRPEYTKLKFLKHYYPNVPIIALTATADKITARDIIKQLRLPKPKFFISSFDRPNLSLAVEPGRKRIEKIFDFVRERSNQSGIIYCISRRSTQDVAQKLKAQKINAAYYHAGMGSKERSKVQDGFINDNITIICATIAFGMGIDKSNIRFIIHYNMPQNIENYYQQIGRAGRDGMPSDTLMFYSYADVMTYHHFIKDEHENKEIELAKLRRIQDFAEAQTCRRKMLLSYFSEYLSEDCGNCDVCKNPPEQFDGTTLAQKALSAIYRLKEMVGMTILIDVLRGSQRIEIIEKGYNKIKTYGLGANLRVDEWQDVMLQLLNQGLIEVAYDQKHVLKITDAGNAVIFNNKKIKLVKPSELIKKQKEIKKEAKPLTKAQQREKELFELIHTLRKNIATQQNVPPHVIFNDATLKAICKAKPFFTEDLLQITGIGEHKRNEYGEAFVNEIINYVLKKSEEGENIKGLSYNITYAYYKRGLNIEEISNKRQLKPGTIFNHLVNSYRNGREINIHDFISEEEINKVKQAVSKVGTDDGLKVVFEHLKQKIDYEKIRFAIDYLRKNK